MSEDQAKLFEDGPPKLGERTRSGKVDIELWRIVGVEESPLEPTAAFVRSVELAGVLEPVLAVPAGDGKYRVPDGKRRVKAAKAVGLDRVPAFVYEGLTEADEQAITLLGNLQRSANVVVEFAAIEELVQVLGSPEAVAESLGIPLTRVRRRLKLQGLIGGLRTAFRDGEIGASVAEAAAALPGAVQQVLVDMFRDKEGHLTLDDVRVVRSVERDKAAAQLPESLFVTEELEEVLSPGEAASQIGRLLLEPTELTIEDRLKRTIELARAGLR